MRKLILFLIVLGNVFQIFAQGATGVKLLSSTQAVINSVNGQSDMMIIKGRITDAETQLPIADARINFDRFGDELVNAAIDKDGNYALAINKKEIGESIRVTFKIDGYQRYIAKSIRTDKSMVALNLNLWPDDNKSSSNAEMKYALSDDTSNTLSVKF